MTGIARFSTPTDGEKPPTGDKREVAKFDMDDFDDYEEPTTAGAKVLQLAYSDTSFIDCYMSILTSHEQSSVHRNLSGRNQFSHLFLHMTQLHYKIATGPTICAVGIVRNILYASAALRRIDGIRNLGVPETSKYLLESF